MTNPVEPNDPLGPLAEAFVRRYRNGEKPSIREYTNQHPDLAERIGKLFPTLVLMEELSPKQETCDGYPVFPETSLPAQLGDFRILDEIGRGGMGIVYRAQQVSLGREVALKVLSGPLSRNAQSLERFQLEARSAGRLHHPNIVPVFEVGHVDDTHYYAMQLIRGQGLDQVLEKLRKGGSFEEAETDPVASALKASTIELNPVSAPPGTESLLSCDRLPNGKVPSTEIPNDSNSPGQLPTGSAVHRIQRDHYRRVAEIGYQLAESIAFAHEQGILHRDVKPSNLLLDQSGHVWVTDFGLAKALESANVIGADLTNTGDVVGTIRYMAPERFRGWSDPRSDVYGMGITLYELLTLRTAFESQDRLALMEKVRSTDPVRPCSIDRRIPRDLETIVLKAIEKEPGARYESAREMALDLRRFLDNRAIRARRTSSIEKTGQWLRRNPVVATLSVTLFVVLIGAWLTTLFFWQRAASSAASARLHLAAEQRNLDLAVSAVDQFCTKVSKDARLNEHDLRPLRQDLLKTAVDFHEQLIQLRDDTGIARIDLARAYHNLAHLTAEIDAQDRAVELYQQAVKEFDGLLREHPEDLQIQFELARSLGALGHLLTDSGNSEQAEFVLQRAVEIVKSIVKTDPSRSDAHTELGRILGLKSYVFRSTQRFEETRAALREAIEQWELVRAQQPESVRIAAELANAHFQLGVSELSAGLKNWRAAETAFATALSVLNPLINQKDAGDFEWSVFAAILRKHGNVAKITGRHEEARKWLNEAITAQEKLTYANPSALKYHHELAATQLELGTCEQLHGNDQASADAIERAIVIWERLADQAPGNVLWETNLAFALKKTADNDAGQGRQNEALAHYGRAVELLDSVLVREPKSDNANTSLPNVLAGRASLLADMERFDQALIDWDRALVSGKEEMLDLYRVKRAWTVVNLGDFESAVADARGSLQELCQHGDERAMQQPYVIGAKICARAAFLAQGEAKRSESERSIVAEEYALDAIDFTRRALAAGYEDSDDLQAMSEFDDLRHRPDFIALFAR